MAFLGGLFGNYTKEGPGVSKDEPQKPPFIRFFQIYFRKFWQLFKLNLIFLVPVLLVAVIMFFLYGMGADARISIVMADGVQFDLYYWTTFVVPIPLILLFPFIPGLCYVTRNYVREEHAFIFSDFKDAVKGNWKFFLLNGVICYFVYTILITAISFYATFSISNVIMTIPMVISILILLVFTFAQFYIPVMQITFEVSFKQLYKNAFIFAIVALPRNFLIALFFAVIIAFFLISKFLGLLLVVAISCMIFPSFSTLMYFVNFVIYPIIKKYLLKPYLGETEDENEEKVKEKEVSSSLSNQELESLQSEFIYVNGKLIRREEYEAESKRLQHPAE